MVVSVSFNGGDHIENENHLQKSFRGVSGAAVENQTNSSPIVRLGLVFPQQCGRP
jgi:hypothetical protein